MSIHFDRPTGAAADVKELEYISALHQTDLTCVRTDGSLRDEDIRLFLLSRYGIDVTVERVRETVIKGLAGAGGGDDADDDECIDLMEMVTILLIPTLLKAAKIETKDAGIPALHPKLTLPRPGLLDYVLGMILQDVTGDKNPKELTPALIKNIFNAYGEIEIAENNKLIDEMIEATKPSIVDNDGSGQTTTDQHDATVPPPKLDLKRFARALTYDLTLYDLNNEIHVSSNYDDIFLTHNQKDKVVLDADDEDQYDDEETVRTKQEREQLSQPVEHRFTASSIDFTAGTYRSKGLTVLLWAAFIVTYFAYNYNAANNVARGDCIAYNYTYVDPWVNNQEAIGCQIYANIYKWLIIFTFSSLYGMAFVGLGSIGNSVETKAFWAPLVGMVVVIVLTLVPFLGLFGSKDKLSQLSNRFLKGVSLVLGLIVCAFHLAHSVALLIPGLVRQIPTIRNRFYALTGTLLGEVYIKQAAAYKLSEMVRNAEELLKHREHESVVDTNFGHGLLSFSKHGKHFREEGGYRWTWKRVFNNELLNREGIWFSTRLLASNISQYIVSVFVLLAGIGLTTSAKNNFNEANAKRVVTNFLNQAVNTNTNPSTVQAVTTTIGNKISNYLVKHSNCTSSYVQSTLDSACHYVAGSYRCDPKANINYLCALANSTLLNSSAYTATQQAAQNAYLQASGFDTSGTKQAVQEALAQASNNALDSFYPSKRFMIVMPVATATVVAFVVSVYLATTYLPSVTSTTLKLRSGVIPSLRDKNFHQYRVAADQVTIVTGSMFWGSVISSTAVGGLVALVVFLFIWQVTVVFVQKFLALMIGITAVVAFKLLLVLTCRCTMYKGFYRRKPLSANLSALALECANFALSAGFVFLRMVKLLLAAAVFIGRIDTPFLAPDVGRVGVFHLDYYPYIYRKDILASEAHRHPYLETLGVMYLMKLRYGENFGKTAGSCWRLLFVYALMPWLHRYRVLARPELLADGDGRQTLVRLQGFKSMKVFDSTDDDDEDDEPAGFPSVSNRKLQPSSAAEVQSAPTLVPTDNATYEIAEMAELRKENEILKQEIVQLKSQLVQAESMAVEVAEDQTRLEL